MLIKKKEKLQKELAESVEEVEELQSGKNKSNGRNSKDSSLRGDDWDGLMHSSKLSDVEIGHDPRNKLPPFDVVKSIFVDTAKECDGH